MSSAKPTHPNSTMDLENKVHSKNEPGFDNEFKNIMRTDFKNRPASQPQL